MANLKNITELPVAESAEGLNLIVNDNGAAKQIAASAVGAQADWNVENESSPAYILNKPEIAQADWAETDESSAAFVKNKPVEEWDLDIVITQVQDVDGNTADPTWIVNSVNTFENIKNKIINGVQLTCKCQVKMCKPTEDIVIGIEYYNSMNALWMTEGDQEAIVFFNAGLVFGPLVTLADDNNIVEVSLQG